MGNNVASAEINETYKISKKEENKLGEGTYGVVYKILNKKTKEIFAGKMFKIPKELMNP